MDSTDWQEEKPEAIADYVIGKLQPGAIVLLHDALFDQMNLPSDREPSKCVDRRTMLSALETILERGERQYDFVTIPELLCHGVPFRDYWFQDGSSPPKKK